MRRRNKAKAAKGTTLLGGTGSTSGGGDRTDTEEWDLVSQTGGNTGTQAGTQTEEFKEEPRGRIDHAKARAFDQRMASLDAQFAVDTVGRADDENMRQMANDWQGFETRNLLGKILSYQDAGWRMNRNGVPEYAGHSCRVSGPPNPQGVYGNWFAAASEFQGVESHIKENLRVERNRCCVKETYDSNGERIRPGLEVIFDLVPNLHVDRFGNKICEMKAVQVRLKEGNFQRWYTPCEAGRHNRRGEVLK